MTNWQTITAMFNCQHCETTFEQRVVVRICPVSEWTVSPRLKPSSEDAKWGYWKGEDGALHIEARDEAALHEFLRLPTLCSDCEIPA
jgi:hypothetical protein